jgi:hypothetical protein
METRRHLVLPQGRMMRALETALLDACAHRCRRTSISSFWGTLELSLVLDDIGLAVGSIALMANASMRLQKPDSMNMLRGRHRRARRSCGSMATAEEMEWFIEASQPFNGLKVSPALELLDIHDYESN